jgi:hypothetical protein
MRSTSGVKGNRCGAPVNTTGAGVPLVVVGGGGGSGGYGAGSTGGSGLGPCGRGREFIRGSGGGPLERCTSSETLPLTVKCPAPI